MKTIEFLGVDLVNAPRRALCVALNEASKSGDKIIV